MAKPWEMDWGAPEAPAPGAKPWEMDWGAAPASAPVANERVPDAFAGLPEPMQAQNAREAAAATMRKRVTNPQAFPTVLAPMLGAPAVGPALRGAGAVGEAVFGSAEHANAAQWLARLIAGGGGEKALEEFIKHLSGKISSP